MISEVFRNDSNSPFVELINELINIVDIPLGDDNEEEEKNAILSVLIDIEVEHSNNVENQIKYYDDNQQKISEAKNELERLMYIFWLSNTFC